MSQFVRTDLIQSSLQMAALEVGGSAYWWEKSAFCLGDQE